MPLPLSIRVVHPDAAVCETYRTRFADVPDFEAVTARFEELPPHDCFVTAANAFGIMTAGIDAAVVAFHGPDLMARVQARIQEEYLGEQPVGTAFLIETGTPGYPWLCHAPTMRVPGNVDGTDKVYAATWAALLAVYRHNAAAAARGGEGRIDTVVFPAMGCGFGGVPHDESARQMAAACRFYFHPPHRLDWDAAIERQKAIHYDGGRRVF